MSASKFFVASKGKSLKTIHLIEPGLDSLAEARKFRSSGCGYPLTETAIYKITWGAVPEFIEGSNISSGKGGTK